MASDSKAAFEEKWLADDDGHNFAVRVYAAPAASAKAVLLFVHGFAEHVGRYAHVHPQFVQRGITVVAFDLRGYGRTALDTEHKSKDSAYGKTNWKAQMRDIEFFGRYIAKEYPGLPIFLMGQSAGGGQVLAFFTRNGAPPSVEATKLFSGVIATSPLILLTHPKPRIIRWIGGKVAQLLPHLLIPADVGFENLSRSKAVQDAAANDPLIKPQGSLRGLDDMLTGGEGLIAEDYKRWPKDLPIFFVHGTEDKVTSYKASEEFYKKLDCVDKKISLYEGAYHELVNEIDGIPERLVEECASWILQHVPQELEEGDDAAEKPTSAEPQAAVGAKL
ncbi:alpha/beta-hydrolase [Trametopsis cervina]|nr:alpha/beta-hydrolase [Trametopsis cervina]